MEMSFSNSSPKISKQSVLCPKSKYLLSLHETSLVEKFEGTEFENGNSFCQIPAKILRYEIFLENLKVFPF